MMEWWGIRQRAEGMGHRADGGESDGMLE